MPVLPFIGGSVLMNKENRLLVTDELVEVQDFMIMTEHFRGIYYICLNLKKEDQKISTCNRLNLETTLGSWPIMLKKSSLALINFNLQFYRGFVFLP